MEEMDMLIKGVDERGHRGLVGHARRSEKVTRYEGGGRPIKRVNERGHGGLIGHARHSGS
jgi:hypothetical protein